MHVTNIIKRWPVACMIVRTAGSDGSTQNQLATETYWLLAALHNLINSTRGDCIEVCDPVRNNINTLWIYLQWVWIGHKGYRVLFIDRNPPFIVGVSTNFSFWNISAKCAANHISTFSHILRPYSRQKNEYLFHKIKF